MSWHAYEDGRAQKALLQLQLEKRKKRGEVFKVLEAPTGNKLAKTFWGHGWCRHLESFSDYENRLPRGRSYLRQGNVYNLSIEKGQITAEVTGSSLYQVTISIQPLTEDAWSAFKSECSGKVGSLLDLLSGKLGEGVLRAITDKDRGLFPTPREIRMNCSCPDYADVCKHAAAVLYGVGVQLDTNPELFFVLRSVDPSELFSTTAQKALGETAQADPELAGEDLSELFGIDLADIGDRIPVIHDREKPPSSAAPPTLPANAAENTFRKKRNKAAENTSDPKRSSRMK